MFKGVTEMTITVPEGVGCICLVVLFVSNGIELKKVGSTLPPRASARPAALRAAARRNWQAPGVQLGGEETHTTADAEKNEFKV